jgi:hypothetical protein
MEVSMLSTSSSNYYITIPPQESWYATEHNLPYRECAGCMKEHIHDRDDYLCWWCRDKPETDIFLATTVNRWHTQATSTTAEVTVYPVATIV